MIMSIGVEKRLITVEEYHKMAEVGILKPEDRVQLINGEIYTMSLVSSLHAAHVKRLNNLFNKILGARTIIGVQDPITIGDHSEPEPDISILHFRKDFYANDHPNPEDVHFLIEVSLSTIRLDKAVKKKLYSSANIPEYWIVNLEEEQVEIYRQPINGEYATEQILNKEDTIFLEKFDLKIEVAKLVLF